MEYSKQVITIVNHGMGEKIAALTREAGARGGTIIVGRGTGGSMLMQLLMLADVEKDIVVTLVSGEQLPPILASIRNAPLYSKKNSGITFVIPTGGTTMNEETAHELITVIVNRGYADDVMDAARKAGARGGTIIHARGTGKPHDEKFFGITIVPEKEEVLILAERSGAKAIRDAIEALPCLSKPGMGIMYTTPVENFVQLGKKAAPGPA